MALNDVHRSAHVKCAAPPCLCVFGCSRRRPLPSIIAKPFDSDADLVGWWVFQPHRPGRMPQLLEVRREGGTEGGKEGRKEGSRNGGGERENNTWHDWRLD